MDFLKRSFSTISDLNPTIKGWVEYFKHAHHYNFSSLDGYQGVYMSC
ncbi:MAG: hypothetical protein ISS66_21590 [Desulfobacteraceae bacterium]|nr:hypothetical protein [Desulfobacteraceae bacterium]